MVIDTTTTPPFIPPVITMDGVGLRLYRRSGPLLDTAISVGSVGCSACCSRRRRPGRHRRRASRSSSPTSRSRRPRRPAASNGVAQGILGNAAQSGGGGDATALKPTFSPELALQKRQGAPGFAWSLTAGSGNGPWLLPINRSFGPLRVDDVGFGDDVSSGRSRRSGSSSPAGYRSRASTSTSTSCRSARPGRPRRTAPRSPTRTAWSLDLAGLAVSYSGGGVQLAGGLAPPRQPVPARRPARTTSASCSPASDPTGSPRSAATASSLRPAGTFTALFVFAAINAPIGGPRRVLRHRPRRRRRHQPGPDPADRPERLRDLPDDRRPRPATARWRATPSTRWTCSRRRSRRNAAPSGSPRASPSPRSRWSTSWRCWRSRSATASPSLCSAWRGPRCRRTYLPLVQLEFALMAHFSTAEGVLEVRAQLTDNSFLLTRDCRLTGGFAYVSWFGPNPNAGQFVLSHRRLPPVVPPARLPDVPRVGYRWDRRSAASPSPAVVFRPHQRGDHGRHQVHRRAEPRAAVGVADPRRRRHRLLRPVPLPGQRLRVDRGRHHDRHRPASSGTSR